MKNYSLWQKTAVLSMLLMSGTTLIAPPSHAIYGGMIGIYMAQGVYDGVNLMAMGGSFSIAVWVAHKVDHTDTKLDRILVWTAVIAGICLLDDHNAISPKFTEITSDEATALNIDLKTELPAYNRDLSLVNQIYQKIDSKTKIYAQTHSSHQELLDYAKDLWSIEGKSLAPETESAVQKIRAGFSVQFPAEQPSEG